MKRIRPDLHVVLLTILLALPLAAAAQGPAPVSVDEAQLDVFSASICVSGRVISRNDARIGAEAEGRITWVAEVGERIEAGDAIARLYQQWPLQTPGPENQISFVTACFSAPSAAAATCR